MALPASVSGTYYTYTDFVYFACAPSLPDPAVYMHVDPRFPAMAMLVNCLFHF